MKSQSNFKLKIVFFGTPDFVVPILDTLTKNYDVVGVMTAPDTIQGRKKILTPTPIKQYVSKHLQNSAILAIQQYNSTTIQQLQDLSPDLFVVAAYGKIIPSSVLAIPRLGAINIHPSLLPKYRGPSPIQTAILNGDKKTGITLIKMDEKMDHGPILFQKEVLITDSDTFASLHISLFLIAAQGIAPNINSFVKGDLKPQEQDDQKATFCHIIKRIDGYFDIQNPPLPENLDRMIRAYYPWPTAWTKIRMKNKELRIMKFLPERKVQLEGGKPITYKEFINGYPEQQETLKTLL